MRLHEPNGPAKSRPMDEFELIDRLIEILGDNARGPAILLGPGDDAALIEIAANSLVVSSIDTLVADVHFPAAAPADLVGLPGARRQPVGSRRDGRRTRTTC